MDQGSDGMPPPPPPSPPPSSLPPPPPLPGALPGPPTREQAHGAVAGGMPVAAVGLQAAALGSHAAADASGAQALAHQQLAQQGQIALQSLRSSESLTQALSSLAAAALAGAQAPSNGNMGEALGRHASHEWRGQRKARGEWVREVHARAGAVQGSKLYAPIPEALDRRVGSEDAGVRVNGH